MNISEEALKKLKCAKCHLYLSIGPVKNADDSFVCGRCSSKGVEVNIYEVLAENFAFPCRYHSFGCQETIKWDFVKTHERNCIKKPHLCAAVPPGICLWRGAIKDMADHFKEKHNEDVTDKNTIEIKLHSNLEGCKLLDYKTKQYIFHVYFNRDQKLLKLNLTQLNLLKTQTYQLTLHSHDLSKRISLATDFIQPYSSMDHNSIKEENIVDLSVLKFLTNDNPSVFCQITLLKDERRKITPELFKLLECPVCSECMHSPIYQCQTGHSFCNPCISKLKDCPLCHRKLTETRNYVLEDLVNQVGQSCKNKDLGCAYYGSVEEVQRHENTCYFYKCPLENSQKCTWSGDFENLIEHCKTSHVYLEGEGYGLLCSLTIRKRGVFRLINSDGMFFKICRRYNNQEFCVVIQFVGPSDKAADYLYEFSFIGGDNSETYLCIRDVCQALSDEENAFDNCLKIPYSLLESFEQNNKLKCNIKIIKKQKEISTDLISSNCNI